MLAGDGSISSKIDQVYRTLVRIYAYQYSEPLHMLNADITAIQNQGKSRERAVLELALKRGLKPPEYLPLIHEEGKSEEQAISEFLKGEVIGISDNDSEVKGIIADVNWNKVTANWTTRERRKRPGKAMYLIPLLFSIVGGLIGYFAVKNTDEVMADRLLFLGILVFLLNLLGLWLLFL